MVSTGVSVGGPTRLTNVAIVRPELLNRDRSVRANAILRQLPARSVDKEDPKFLWESFPRGRANRRRKLVTSPDLNGYGAQ